MTFASIEKIADAVLFEGYILYPYRASAIKNRQRWNFGTLYPRAYVDAQAPSETAAFHAEVLIEGSIDSVVDARVRFLELMAPGADGQAHWSEGLVRSRSVEGLTVGRLMEGFDKTFDFAGLSDEECSQAAADYRPVSTKGRLTLKGMQVREGLYRIHAAFSNETAPELFDQNGHEGAQACAFTSAHLLLNVQRGEFISLLEPQAEVEAEAKRCVNQGVFPVLAGEKSERSRMLCSPIILYDYPQVAPESRGDYFDGCEMDEMLALRVMTLTDEEKAEIRGGDARAREILARTETLPPDHLLKLHGAVRGLRPVAEVDASSGMHPWNPFDERPPVEMVRIFGIEVRAGDRVRIWPRKKADIMDMAMEGKVAIVEAIEQDLDDNVQLAVVLEDDPGRDMGMLRQPGHRFFFHPEEVEPLTQEVL